MSIEKINDTEFNEHAVASLPIRPNASSAYGHPAMTAKQLKEAFDALPSLIRDKYNALVDAIKSVPDGNGSLASEILTGIGEGHTLSDLFSDIANGEFAKYARVDDKTIALAVSEIDTVLSSSVRNVSYNPSDLSITVTFNSGEVKNLISPSSSLTSITNEAIARVREDINREMSALYYVDGNNADMTYTLIPYKECDLINHQKLTVELPETITAGFSAMIHFSCPEAITTYLPSNANVIPSGETTAVSRPIIYIGDDVNDEGNFSSLNGYRYSMLFIFDGQYLCCNVTRNAIPS
ncbi:MAG: hypothetical protein SOZ62_02620 [Eubacteriales bacterium]|nr:hypothetical protein [Eubacteriales bacterium]